MIKFLKTNLLVLFSIFMLLGCTNDSEDTNQTSEQSDDNSLDYGDIDLRDTNATITADFYTPAPMIDLLDNTPTTSWSVYDGSLKHLSKFSFGDSSTSDIINIEDTSTQVLSSLSISSSLATNNTPMVNSLLKSTFEFVEIQTGKFAIYSVKHQNYALDVNDSDDSIILRDVRSYGAFTSAKNGGTKPTFLTFDTSLNINGRYILDTSSDNDSNTATTAFDKSINFTATATPSNTKLTIISGKLMLGSTATTMKIYNAPIGLEIPYDNNPDLVSRVSNKEVYFTDAYEGDTFDKVEQDMMSAYKSQVTAKGLNTSTTSAVEAMLDSIQTSLASQNTQLRYPKEFYLKIREGFFKRQLVSGEALDGDIGELTVPYVYFTNEQDDDNNYHPFMVIASHGIPDTLALLRDVPHPPGDGISSGGYTNENVTRSFYMENFILKIPIRDYGEISSLTENDLSSIKSLASDVGSTSYDHHNYASTGSSGVAIDGVVIYPSYNNTLTFAQEPAELSLIGMHSGRGLGVHYHADASLLATHNATDNTQDELQLYNKSDYTGHTHPPIVSIGFDGIAGYGYYLPNDTTSHGANVALDSYGGHEHGDYGYHYHAFSTSRTTQLINVPPEEGGGTRGGNTYNTHECSPLGAWKGRINQVPEFEQRINRSKYTGNP